MGGHISCVHQSYVDEQAGEATSGEVDKKTVRLIMADGRVKVYHRPVLAGELMVEFPKHLLCHADTFFIGKKVPPLAETDRLLLGNKYFLLPRHFFQTTLTFVTIASFAAADEDIEKEANGNDEVSSLKKKEMVNKLLATCKAFDIQKTPGGRMQIRVSDEFIAKLMEEGRLREEAESRASAKEEKVCTTPELQKDYSQLVECRRSLQWKPKLETIREKDKRKIGRFGIRRRKIKPQKSHETEKDQKKSDQKNQRKKKKEVGLKDVKEELGWKAPQPPPPPPPPPAPLIRSFSSKIKWKKRL